MQESHFSLLSAVRVSGPLGKPPCHGLCSSSLFQLSLSTLSFWGSPECKRGVELVPLVAKRMILSAPCLQSWLISGLETDSGLLAPPPPTH